jgi:ATP-dependent protease HslVU (ClpYQ) peptidase subunit
MTTVAFDGNMLACDTLMLDEWDTRDTVDAKVWVGNNVMIGFAGPFGKILKYQQQVLHPSIELSKILEEGYKAYVKNEDDPSILLVCKHTGQFWRTASGMFCPTRHKYWAIGSGRDYALAAMYHGCSARKAVITAAHFDNNTNAEVQCYTVFGNKDV